MQKDNNSIGTFNKKVIHRKSIIFDFEISRHKFINLFELLNNRDRSMKDLFPTLNASIH